MTNNRKPSQNDEKKKKLLNEIAASSEDIARITGEDGIGIRLEELRSAWRGSQADTYIAKLYAINEDIRHSMAEINEMVSDSAQDAKSV